MCSFINAWTFLLWWTRQLSMKITKSLTLECSISDVKYWMNASLSIDFYYKWKASKPLSAETPATTAIAFEERSFSSIWILCPFAEYALSYRVEVVNIASSVNITRLPSFTALWIYYLIDAILSLRIRGSSYLNVLTKLNDFLLIPFLAYIFLIWLGLIFISPNFLWNSIALSCKDLFAQAFKVSIFNKKAIWCLLNFWGLPLRVIALGCIS